MTRKFSALTREIAAIHRDALPPGAGNPRMLGAERTSTGVAVVKFGPPGAPPCGVLKITASAEASRALARETAILTTLHADPRLGAWRELLPRPRAHGTLRGHSYRIDSILDGRAVVKPSAAARPRLVSAAAETIAVLHEMTATTIHGGPDLAERWVDAPLRELSRHAGRWRWLTSRLELLRDELHGALNAGTFRVAWIHGDYWLGNLLFSGTGTPTGIVDWEGAAPLELAFHDLVHLLLYTRRLATGRELGHMLCDHLKRERWTREERALLERQDGPLRGGSLSKRHVLLLYWLRHAGVHARQHSSPVGFRYRLWERRNVLPVLESL